MSIPVMRDACGVFAETRSVYVMCGPPPHQLTHLSAPCLLPPCERQPRCDARRDTSRKRTNAQRIKSFVMTNLETLMGVPEAVKFVETRGMLKKSGHAVG